MENSDIYDLDLRFFLLSALTCAMGFCGYLRLIKMIILFLRGSPREIGKDVISWGKFEKTKPIFEREI